MNAGSTLADSKNTASASAVVTADLPCEVETIHSIQEVGFSFDCRMGCQLRKNRKKQKKTLNFHQICPQRKTQVDFAQIFLICIRRYLAGLDHAFRFIHFLNLSWFLTPCVFWNFIKSNHYHQSCAYIFPVCEIKPSTILCAIAWAQRRIILM